MRSKIWGFIAIVSLAAATLFITERGQAQKRDDYTTSTKTNEIDACYRALSNAWSTHGKKPSGECSCEASGAYHKCKVKLVPDNRGFRERQFFGVGGAFDATSKAAACTKAKSQIATRWAKTQGACKCGKRHNDVFCYVNIVPKNYSPPAGRGAVTPE